MRGGGSRGWLRLLLVFACLVLYRCVCNVWTIRTAFNPDELWQSVEVAHELVWPHHGHRTWEFHDDYALRGAAFPAIFAALYAVIRAVGVDSPAMVRIAPRVLHGLFIVLGDVHFLVLARRLLPARIANWAVRGAFVSHASPPLTRIAATHTLTHDSPQFFAYLTNWFTFYCLIRTFSNSLECALTLCALAYWPLDDAQPVAAVHVIPHIQRWLGNTSTASSSSSSARCHFVSLIFASLACLVRPTSAVLWCALATWHLVRHHSTWSSRCTWIFAQVVPIAAASLLVSLCLDRWLLYDRWTLPAWNFLRYNSLYGVARVYGVNATSYYVTEALPAMLLSMLPCFVHGVWVALVSADRSRIGSPLRLPLLALVVTTAVTSLSPHKEYRFILPTYPICFLFVGVSMHRTFDGSLTPMLEACQEWLSVRATSAQPPSTLAKRPERHHRRSLLTTRPLVLLTALMLVQLVAVLYFGLVHQAAPLATMTFLASRLERIHRHMQHTDACMRSIAQHGTHHSLAHRHHLSVHFWTECHALPLYSHLHVSPLPELRFFGCPPPLDEAGALMAYQRDPCAFAAQFARRPESFVRQLYGLRGVGGDGGGGGGGNVLTSRACLVDSQLANRSATSRNVDLQSNGPIEGLPTHVVLFESHARAVARVLDEQGYVRIAVFSHTWTHLFSASSDDQREVHVFERRRRRPQGREDDARLSFVPEKCVASLA